jgi:predicted nucleic acid-binding protein
LRGEDDAARISRKEIRIGGPPKASILLRMLDCVFDTNVVVAGLRSRRGASHELLRLVASGTIRLHISVALALEYEEVLKRPGLLPDVSEIEIDEFLDDLFGLATLRKSVPKRGPLSIAASGPTPDPDDEGILELAAKSNAVVVTHNVRHFIGADRLGVIVLTPDRLLKLLRGGLA